MAEIETSTTPKDEPPPKAPDRVFLVVIDDTAELQIALRYACRRAWNSGGRVALLHVAEEGEVSPFAGVERLMEEESRQAAEQLMQKMASEVQKLSGSMPVLYFREGSRREQVLRLIEEEPSISILVLGAATTGKGPGPLVAALTGKFVGKMRVPVTIVPGNLTDADIEKIA
jgi:nucleotide-binding universal stress UspA family protein